MKKLKYILLGLTIAVVIGFGALAIVEVKVPQKNVEISISPTKNQN